MKKHISSIKAGFTIIEVALFLALSGILMIGLIAGANSSIARQRYNDSVNSFAEFVRGVYADVLNVSSDKNPDQASEKAGRETKAVYGKLISIGEEGAGNTIYVYDLVGNAVSSSSVSSTRIIDMMHEDTINANIFKKDCSATPASCSREFYRMTSYAVPWEAVLSRGRDAGSNNGYPFHGTILIIRSPVTGNIRTYTFNHDHTAIQAQLNTEHITTNFHTQNATGQDYNNFKKYLTKLASTSVDNGGENEMIICVDSDDNPGPNRRGVKIAVRATNSSGVTLTEMDRTNADCENRDTF